MAGTGRQYTEIGFNMIIF